MCWPCCHNAIYRLQNDGTLVWKKDWSSQYGQSASFIRVVVTDGTYIYAGGTRVSPTGTSGDASEVFTVRCYDGNGAVVWETDVGANVHSMLFVSGVGLYVGHLPSHNVADAVTLTRNTGTSTVTLFDEVGGAPSVNNSDSAATIQATLEAQPRLTGLVSVSGASFAAGMSFTFDSSLGSTYSSRRPAILPGPGSNFTLTCSSIADLTLLDESDGSVLWTAWIENGRPSTGQLNGLTALCPFGSNVLATIGTDQFSTGNALFEINSSGSVVSSHNIGAGAVGVIRGLVSDGSSNYFVGLTGVGATVTKYNSSHVLQWSTGRLAPLTIEGSDCWARSAAGTFKKLSAAAGADLATITGTGTYEDLAIRSDSAYVLARGTTSSVNDRAQGWDASYAKEWNYGDGAKNGLSVIQFDGDIIGAGERT